MIVAGRIRCGRGGWGVARGNGWRIRESGIPNRGMGGGFGNRGFRNRGIGGAGIGVRETGNPGIADFRNSRNSGSGNGFGIDGCAQLCARERNSAEFAPGNRESGTRKPPN